MKITMPSVSAQTSDQVLVERIKAHDPIALSCLYDSYAQLVFVLAYRITGQVEEAEDIVTESFWQIWQQASHYQTARGHVRQWILTIARSRALDRLRVLRRTSYLDTELSALSTHELQCGTTPEHDLWQSEQARQVRRALQTLPPKQREVLELAYYLGLTQTEIADRLREPLGTIKTRIRLALTKMREELVPAHVAVAPHQARPEFSLRKLARTAKPCLVG